MPHVQNVISMIPKVSHKKTFSSISAATTAKPRYFPEKKQIAIALLLSSWGTKDHLRPVWLFCTAQKILHHVQD